MGINLGPRNTRATTARSRAYSSARNTRVEIDRARGPRRVSVAVDVAAAVRDDGDGVDDARDAGTRERSIDRSTAARDDARVDDAGAKIRADRRRATTGRARDTNDAGRRAATMSRYSRKGSDTVRDARDARERWDGRATRGTRARDARDARDARGADKTRTRRVETPGSGRGREGGARARGNERGGLTARVVSSRA